MVDSLSADEADVADVLAADQFDLENIDDVKDTLAQGRLTV